MEDCAPFAFIRNWAMVAPYLCSRFRIFDKPVLKEYVSHVERAHICFSYVYVQCKMAFLLQLGSCTFFLYNLIIIGALSLHAPLMDIHHDTSFRTILEDDSISLTSRTHIHFCSSKGAKLWLVTRPSIHSFCIAHSIFISALRFHFNLIHPLASSLFMCEGGHKLDAFGTLNLLFVQRSTNTHT